MFLYFWEKRIILLFLKKFLVISDIALTMSREGEGFLFVFDVNNAESLNTFAEWRELIKRVKEKEKVSSES